ncbi:putative kinase [Nymphon striatum]|nr:putative kinase [Nymphon striatum]
MFKAESLGLKEIQNSNTIKTPKPICYGHTNDSSYLVLEFISLSGAINQATMGRQLAKMHQTTNSNFGWKYDNTIGSTPQQNQENDSWLSFWKEQRLIYQLELALKKGYSKSAYEKGLRLANTLRSFFDTYHPLPSLLHGDLWGGNCAADSENNPVIYDPAVYYGDREADLAMTELFGGFNNEFYSAYNNEYPLHTDYKTRKTLYNLYHILNHYNLFGGGYASQATSMTEYLLSEIS